jgi:hypothetical protein
MGHPSRQKYSGTVQSLGIDYHLHCAWQSSGKVEKTNELLKRYLTKLVQGTQSPSAKLLPISILKLRNTPGK